MPCFTPLHGWRAAKVGPSGKRGIVFEASKGLSEFRMLVPCGKCVGCLLERSRQWAMRCVHESSQFDFNCSLTLTFDDLHLPLTGSVCVRDVQLFMKRLRKRVGKVRFFSCGEYGDKFNRPHYHLILFGYDFPDKVFAKTSRCGKFRLYSSQILEEVWGNGMCLIGDVSFESCAYVARYILKKRSGGLNERIDLETGNVEEMAREFVTMSRRPGIGSRWFDEFGEECYRNRCGSVVMRSKEMRPPKFYDGRFEALHPERFEAIKFERMKLGLSHAVDSTDRRLRDREIVEKSKVKLLKRSFEDG